MAKIVAWAMNLHKGKLVFIGMGLWDAHDLSIRALDAIRKCEKVYAEFYTSALRGTSVEKLERFIGKPITVLTREEVERGDFVGEAKQRAIAFLVPGDAMSATTHLALRLKAAELGVATEIVYGVSVFTAAASALGLMHYKFGRTTTIPLPRPNYRPTSPYFVLRDNKRRGLHTLVLLEYGETEYLTPNAAMAYLLDLEKDYQENVFREDTLVCVLARLGSHKKELTKAGPVHALKKIEWGEPLHCMVVPGELHFLEREALTRFANAPPSSNCATHPA